jgi:hypothetical protein
VPGDVGESTQRTTPTKHYANHHAAVETRYFVTRGFLLLHDGILSVFDFYLFQTQEVIEL